MHHVDDLLCFQIYAANNAMNRLYQPLLEALGLTYTQYLVLLILWKNDNSPVGQIGARLGLESNTLTPLLKRMEKLDFVKRNRSTSDERQVIVALTTKGRNMRGKSTHLPACVLEASGLTLNKVTSLRRDLLRLRHNLTHC